MRNDRKARIAGAAVIIFLTVLAYLPAMLGKFIWDDDSWTRGISDLLRNLQACGRCRSSPSALQQYYPLTGATAGRFNHLKVKTNRPC